MTAGTVVVLVVVVAIVAAIIIKAIRDRKAGKNSCGGDCAHCGYGCDCAETVSTETAGGSTPPESDESAAKPEE